MLALPHASRRYRWPAWTAFAVLVGLSGMRLAAASAPAPDVTMTVKRTQTETKDQDSNGKKGADIGDSKQGYYIVTLINEAKTPVTLDLNYTIYTRTTSVKKGKTKTSVHEANNDQSVDLAPGESKDVETDKIGLENSEKVDKKGNKSSLKKEILGVWIQASVDGTVAAQSEDPLDIKEKMAAKEADQSQPMGDSGDQSSSTPSSSDSDSQ
jgi:hypothetical protein